MKDDNNCEAVPAPPPPVLHGRSVLYGRWPDQLAEPALAMRHHLHCTASSPPPKHPVILNSHEKSDKGGAADQQQVCDVCACTRGKALLVSCSSCSSSSSCPSRSHAAAAQGARRTVGACFSLFQFVSATYGSLRIQM